MSTIHLTATLACLIADSAALATVVEYHNNKTAWQAATGNHTTIDFVGFLPNTNITTQYERLGVTFTDGIDLILPGFNLFPNDGQGLNGAFDTIALEFSQPMTAIAVDHPGNVQINLFWRGQPVYTALFSNTGAGFFSGLVSDQPFDSILLYDNGVFIDDLHFGPPIPAPGALGLLGITALVRRRRRS